MKQYADTPAAIALGLFFLGGVFYVAQLLLMTGSWLAQNNVGPEAVPVAQVLGCAWLGYMVALLRTFVKGPTGSGPFFIALVVAQLGVLIVLWLQSFAEAYREAVFDDAIIVSVLTALLLFGWARIRSRI
ncbi:MAG: hypothetical protein EBZ14_05425 [Gammaproteobacteria bacterium]|nr:hypothetical protein [Gammaproteobacteria bacterium]NDA14674.1 hypothetical protein [Gammaproteobacteria bacterium]NDG44531.1 hypothetical protein [Gammaproteobacteria bacterium]